MYNFVDCHLHEDMGLRKMDSLSLCKISFSHLSFGFQCPLTLKSFLLTLCSWSPALTLNLLATIDLLSVTMWVCLL